MTQQVTFKAGLMDASVPTPQGLSNGQGQSAHKRFDVYRNNVMSSLIAAMEQGFPVIRMMVGAEFFSALAAEALRAYHPTDPVMHHIGRRFPAFLEAFPPVAHLPYLPDVARLELALRESYHAPNPDPARPVFNADLLQRIEPANLMTLAPKAVPAVRLIRSKFPIGSLWLNHQPNATPRALQGGEDVLISRPGFDPIVDVLPSGGYPVMRALNGQTPLAVAFAQANDALDLAALMSVWISRQALFIKEVPDS